MQNANLVSTSAFNHRTTVLLAHNTAIMQLLSVSGNSLGRKRSLGDIVASGLECLKWKGRKTDLLESDVRPMFLKLAEFI